MSAIVGTTKEAINVGHWAVTLTLKPANYKFNLGKQVDRVIKDWPFKGLITAVLEITKKQNIHLHCYFKTIKSDDDFREAVADALRDSKVFGFYDVKPLLEKQDQENWKQYMFKEIDKTIRRIGYSHIHDNLKICSCNHGLVCYPYKAQT